MSRLVMVILLFEQRSKPISDAVFKAHYDVGVSVFDLVLEIDIIKRFVELADIIKI